MSSGYRRLENTGQHEYEARLDEDQRSENDRLVSAFDDNSDDDNNSIDDWNDDRNIEMNHVSENSNSFIVGEDDEDEAANYRRRHDVFHSEEAPQASGIGSEQDSTSIPQFSAETNESHSFLATSRGLAHDLLSSFRGVPLGPRAAPPNNNDGVFANITAKPDSHDPGADDKPPTYEEAAADSTPPYWETTIMAPGLSDELFIEGLPVGSPINFAWNMMVSAAFQFVGFFLTYLLHTSHAAKQGSRAGLGFTLVQCGYYLQPQDGDSDGGSNSSPPAEINPSDPNDANSGSAYASGMSRFSQSSGSPNTVISQLEVDGTTTSWISTTLMVVGTLIMLKSVADYLQARRMEIAILNVNGNSASSAVPDPEEETTEAEERV